MSRLIDVLMKAELLADQVEDFVFTERASVEDLRSAWQEYVDVPYGCDDSLLDLAQDVLAGDAPYPEGEL